MNILAIVRGGMGDLVCDLAVLQSLKAGRNGSPVDITVLATNQRCLDAARFLRGRSAIDGVLDWTTVGYGRVLKTGPLLPELVNLIERSDLVLQFDVDDRRAFKRVSEVGGSRVHAIDYRPQNGRKLGRICDVLVEAARDRGLPLGHDPVPRIDMPNVGTEPDLVVLAPGAGEVAKLWPIAGWLTVAEWHRQRGRRVLWALGPLERNNPTFRPIYERLGAQFKLYRMRGEPFCRWINVPADPDSSDVDFSAEWVLADGTLEDRMLQIVRAAEYTGSDSGLTHLVAACGVPRVRCIWNGWGMLHNYPFWSSPCPNVVHVLPEAPLNPPVEKVFAGVE